MKIKFKQKKSREYDVTYEDENYYYIIDEYDVLLALSKNSGKDFYEVIY